MCPSPAIKHCTATDFRVVAAGILTCVIGVAGYRARPARGRSARPDRCASAGCCHCPALTLDVDPAGRVLHCAHRRGSDPGRDLRDRLCAAASTSVPSRSQCCRLFVAAMLLVPAAGSVTTFLLAWELMALASLILVLAEHTRPEVRSAGLFYAVMTQLGFVADPDRADGVGRGRRQRPVRRHWPRVPDGARTAVFVLTLPGSARRRVWCHCTPGCRAPTPRRRARCRR